MTENILDYCGGVFGAAWCGQRPFALPGDKPHYARDRVVSNGELLGVEELGDERAISALERLAGRDLDGRVVRRCREAIARQKGGELTEEQCAGSAEGQSPSVGVREGCPLAKLSL